MAAQTGAIELPFFRKNSDIFMAVALIGILALIEREPLFAFFGLILIMFGFRLMARGLDRIDKTVFIESYNEEE